VTLFADFNSSVSVPFQRMRALLLESGGGLQEGVIGAQASAGDLKVAQRAASANLSADVALGAAWITIDTGTRNGIGHIFSDATFNAGPFTAGNATNPRVDQVIARWNDTSIPTARPWTTGSGPPRCRTTASGSPTCSCPSARAPSPRRTFGTAGRGRAARTS
jgi:hypothetical protein